MMPSRLLYGGIFLIGACLAALPVMQLHILAATTWPYLAFPVLATALSGAAVPAFWRGGAEPGGDPAARAAKMADDLGLFILVALMGQMFVPVLQGSIWGSLATGTALSALMALPYYKGSACLTQAMAGDRPDVGARACGPGLAGAAAGVCLAYGAMAFFGPPSSMLVLSVAAFAAALCFMRGASGDGERPKIVAKSMIALTGVALAVNVTARHPFIYPHWDRSGQAVREAPAFDEWKAATRVTVRHEIKGGVPVLRGGSPFLPDEARSSYYTVAVDGDPWLPVDRYEGIPETLIFLDYDVTGIAYALSGIDRAAIIGIGGGRDVLAAHYAGVRDITAIGANDGLIALLGEKEPFKTYAGLSELPGLRIINGDVRVWFDRNGGAAFDLIQIGLTESLAATEVGAGALSGMGRLHTVEGWGRFLDALDNNGLLVVNFWLTPVVPTALDGFLRLAERAALDAGAQDPRVHVFVASTGSAATLVLSKAPLTEDRIAVLEEKARARGFDVLVSPAGPDAFESIASVRADLPTDDRPFFFASIHAAKAVRGLFAAMVVPFLILLLFVGRTGCAAGAVWLVLNGLGLGMADAALIRKADMMTGCPVWVLAAALLIAMAFGAVLSGGRFPLTTARRRAFWIVATVVFVLAFAFTPVSAFPVLAALVFPLGVLQGGCLSAGLDRARSADEKTAARLWGIGVLSCIAGGVLAQAFNIALGLNWTIILGGLCYGLLILPSAGFGGYGKRA